MKKTVLYISGSRADFGRITTTLYELLNKDVSIKIFATGQHFSIKHGYTISEVKKESFGVIEANSFIEGDEPFHMLNMYTNTSIALNNFLKSNDIDLILLLGDRNEMLAGAICAAHYNIPIAHIGGGQQSGSIDNSIRDAVTVFSDIHLCATAKNKERIKKIKGSDKNIYIVGAPDIDMIKKIHFPKKEYLFHKYNLNILKPVFLLIQHPVTTEIREAKNQIRCILSSLYHFNAQILCILPNTDMGGMLIREVIEKEKKLNLRTHSHITYKDFLSLMNYADILIGNSSAGIIEAASFHLPVVNIGTRQQNRQQSKNVINTSFDKNQIIKSIKTCLTTEFKQKVSKIKNIYGDGEAGKRIGEILKRYMEEYRS